jgi:hypothetical protein
MFLRNETNGAWTQCFLIVVMHLEAGAQLNPS